MVLLWGHLHVNEWGCILQWSLFQSRRPDTCPTSRYTTSLVLQIIFQIFFCPIVSRDEQCSLPRWVRYGKMWQSLDMKLKLEILLDKVRDNSNKSFLKGKWKTGNINFSPKYFMFYFIFFVVSPTHKSNCKDKRWKYKFEKKTINITNVFLDNWISSYVCHERKRDYIWIKVCNERTIYIIICLISDITVQLRAVKWFVLMLGRCRMIQSE